MTVLLCDASEEPATDCFVHVSAVGIRALGLSATFDCHLDRGAGCSRYDPESKRAHIWDLCWLDVPLQPWF